MTTIKYALAKEKYDSDERRYNVVTNAIVSKEAFYAILEAKAELDNDTNGIVVKCVVDTDGSKLFYVVE